MFYRRELKVFDAIQKQIHTRVSPNYNIKNFDCSVGIITDDTLYLLTYSKFLFIHIPKTAGVTLKNYLIPDYVSIKKNSFEYNKKYLHSPVTTWMPMFRSKLDRPTIISMVRNPFDRLTSLYRFRKYISRDYSIPNDITFKEWVGDIRKYETQSWGYVNGNKLFADCPQTYWTHQGGENKIDKLLRFENLPDNLSELNKYQPLRKGKAVPDKKYPEEFSENNSKKYLFKKKDYREYYDDETRKIVTDWYIDDLKSFNYQF
jgi:hypothetical protein